MQRRRRSVRRRHPPQQVVPDAGPADGDQADHLVGAVAEPVTQLVASSRVGSLTHDVAGEVEVLLGPLPRGRQVRPERQVHDVVGVAHEDGTVAQPGSAGDVLDHLGVVVGGQERLPLAPVRHRHPPDEVGHPDERRTLERGVLVEEVVEVPRLVADPQVEGLALHQVVEDHEVVDQHLVHAAYGVEGVQVVLARLGLEVPGLARQEPGGRVDRLAPLLQELRDRRLGEPLDLEVRAQLTHRVGDSEVAAHVAEADGGGQVEHPRAPAARPAGLRQCRRTRGPVDERLDGAVDHDRVPRHRQVSRPLQHQVLGAGPGHDAAAAALRLAQVRGPLDDEHRGGDPTQQPLGLGGGVGEARTCVLGQDHRTGGLPGEADDVLELLGGVRLGEHLVEEELGVLRPVLGQVVPVVAVPPGVVVELVVEVPRSFEAYGEGRGAVPCPGRDRHHPLDAVGVEGGGRAAPATH